MASEERKGGFPQLDLEARMKALVSEAQVEALSETFRRWGWDEQVPYVLKKWAEEGNGTFTVNPDGGFLWEKRRKVGHGSRGYLTTRIALEPSTTDHFPSIDIQMVRGRRDQPNLSLHIKALEVSNMVCINKRRLPFKARETEIMIVAPPSLRVEYGFIINKDGELSALKHLT